MRIKIPILILCLILSMAAHAAVVKDLYSVKVLVPDQSTASWDKALPNALTEVLVKLSGNPEVANDAAVKQALPKAKLWVKSYGYHEQWQDEQSQLWLRFDFDTKPIDQLLAQVHQSKWSNDRPLTLVWLELDQGEAKPQLVDAENSLKTVMQQNADRRGLPILLPTMDLEDQQHMGQTLNNPAEWEWAFSRYGVKAVLVGQFKSVRGKSQGQWLLMAGNDSKQWDVSSGDVNEFMANGLDESANWMAKQQIVGNDPHAKIVNIKLQVVDVQDLADYAKISDYLSQLSFIRHVSLGGVNGEGMLFELKIAGTQEQLVRALSSSSELTPDESGHSSGKNVLYYRWIQGAELNTSSELVMPSTSEVSQ